MVWILPLIIFGIVCLVSTVVPDKTVRYVVIGLTAVVLILYTLRGSLMP